ncbi:endogenous retrovirus group K member 25 Pol protein [Eptesicus fuscus]|uniref:endogenous retrovirus group K member 25 Pol protein n=1 Tax=Eptesicus fuscus TaxID=29078 RepID=UPI0024047362|nr:endogenous retrovirus group K member 25 Pol protein [Eptesicus fuscus]
MPEEKRRTSSSDFGGGDFLVDTGATFSVFKSPVGPTSKERVTVQGANGKIQSYPWTRGRISNLGTGLITHSFLVMPECPYPLLGRDLLTKLKATITFEEGQPEVKLGTAGVFLLTLPQEEAYRLHEEPNRQPSSWLPVLREEIPQVWAEDNPPGLAAHRPPIIVQLVSIAEPIRVKQYPMSQKARVGIAKHIRRLREAGILIPCQSPWNTPLLPVQKPGTDDYRPVQDLREVNKQVETIHPTVPNPYTLLSHLRPECRYYTVLDLKDAFFSLPLAPQSRSIFAFEWTDPEEGSSGQLTWTRLPQGFKNSPTLFGEDLSQDLVAYRLSHPRVTLLQYVDDLLVAAENSEECLEATRDLTTGTGGFRVPGISQEGPNI